jgi:hypothetical protein
VPRPVIALLTDFGLRDHYVAAMKGVMLGICPDATLIDISHGIAPQDILGGALELEAVARFCPTGTVFVAVVDPGVGSSRRGIAVEAGGMRLVGPDNGLLSLAVERLGAPSAVEVSNARYTREAISQTFEGRDRFAPAAAWLATGVALRDLGPPVDGIVVFDVPQPSSGDGWVDGVVLRVDHFGNLITNITRADLDAVGERPVVKVASAFIDGVSTNYAAAGPGRLCALVGSTGRLEIAVNGGSAAARLDVVRGAAVRVRARSAA